MRIAIRIILFIVLLELFFRCGGTLFHSAQQVWDRWQVAQRKDATRVMCIGESTTASGGAHSFPSQLEKILNASSQSRKFVVINQGVAGQTTEYIGQNLEAWISEYHPDIVVAMIGINDERVWLDHESEEKQFSGPRFIERLSVVKSLRSIWKAQEGPWFIELLQTNQNSRSPDLDDNGGWRCRVGSEKLNKASRPTTSPQVARPHKAADPKLLREVLKQGMLLRNAGNYKQADKIFATLIAQDLEDNYTQRVHQEFGKSLMEQKRYRELTQLMTYFLKNNVLIVEARHWLDFLCTDSSVGAQEAIRFLEEQERNFPQDARLKEMLGGCYGHRKDLSRAQAYFSQADVLRLRGYNPEVRRYYQGIYAQLRAHHIQAIVVQYPMRKVDELKRLFADVDEKEAIVFVDNEKIFKDAIEIHGYDKIFTDRFAGDFGHGTVEGNRLLAQNIAQAMLEEGGGL